MVLEPLTSLVTPLIGDLSGKRRGAFSRLHKMSDEVAGADGALPATGR